jgi:hypothetical protein
MLAMQAEIWSVTFTRYRPRPNIFVLVHDMHAEYTEGMRSPLLLINSSAACIVDSKNGDQKSKEKLEKFLPIRDQGNLKDGLVTQTYRCMAMWFER